MLKQHAISMRNLLGVALLASGLALAGCSSPDPFAGTGSPRYTGSEPMPKGGGRAVVGKPYSVAGKKFYPKLDPNYDKVGLASWYGPKFHKRMTSNGEWFDMEYLSAAHATMPLPSYAQVTNLENGRTIVVRVNDRGPFVDTRIIDLSKKSAEVLGFQNKGLAKVRVQYIGPAPTDDKGDHLMAMNDAMRNGVPKNQLIAVANRGGKSDRRDIQIAQNASPAPSADTGVVQSTNDGYFVQAGLFANPVNAANARQRLSAIGPVEVVPIQNDVGTYYRVRLGPLASTDQAMSALTEVHAAGMPDARILVAQN